MSLQDVSTEISTTTSDPGTESRDETIVADDEEDSGILNFMAAEEAIKLYQRIVKEGIPKLEWEFYGRRKPEEQAELEAKIAQCDATDGTPSKEQQEQEAEKATFDNSEFDFDESFSELKAETSAIGDSLQLKKRFEPGSERKTNLSDIMSDIMKETSYSENDNV